MKKVIEAKKQSNLREHDYYSYEKYNKTVLAFSDVNEKSFEEGFFKRFPFLKDHIEVCNETGQLILPVSVDESVVRHIYRKDPESDKTIILAERSNGVNELINSGQMLSTMLKDIFAGTDADYSHEHALKMRYRHAIFGSFLCCFNSPAALAAGEIWVQKKRVVSDAPEAWFWGCCFMDFSLFSCLKTLPTLAGQGESETDKLKSFR